MGGAKGILFLTSLVLLLAPALAHVEGAEPGVADTIAFDARVLWLAVAIILVLVFIGVKYQSKLKVRHEKIIFVGVAIASLAATGYLIGLTTYWVVTSATGGPVHWHADYEIWICGEEFLLPHPVGLENRVGTATLHHHDDNRIHVEGIPTRLEETNLGHFFEVIGGELESDLIAVPQDLPPDSRPLVYRNGDACPNGNPGTLYVFVNGGLIDEPAEHIIAPFSTVPPGDEIKIIFDDRPAEQLNPNLREAP
jgi:hypothetical protein